MSICELCQSTVQIIGSHNLSNFGKCVECGLLQNSKANLESRLEGLDFETYLLAQDLTFEKIRRLTVLVELEQVLKARNLELKVFDIGTGSGEFLKEAQDLGFKVAGSELSSTAASVAKRKFGFEIVVENYEDLDLVESECAVTMFCVLAHSSNPELLLKSIHQSLQSGGILYFHTPRFCTIDILAIFINRITLGRMNRLLLRRIGGDHKRIYSEKSLSALLKQAGFTDFTICSEIGYGLKKEFYFTAMGIPQILSKVIAFLLNIVSKFSLLPRNVFSVYASKS